MIDGRSLYMPLFSGVIWDAIDVPLGDVEQIEVVRGPGAVMWGPNAVNGVINIITKKASQTKGTRVTASAGNETRSLECPLGCGSQRSRRLPDLGKSRLPDPCVRLARRLLLRYLFLSGPVHTEPGHRHWTHGIPRGWPAQ